MIICGEIALFVMGLIALVTGKFAAGRGRVVRGTPARCLGLVALMPVPVAFTLAFLAGLLIGALQLDLHPGTINLIGGGIELAVLLGFVGAITYFGNRMADPVPSAEDAGPADVVATAGSAKPAPVESDVWRPFDEEPPRPRHPARLVVLTAILTTILGALGLFVWIHGEPADPAGANPGFVAAPAPARNGNPGPVVDRKGGPAPAPAIAPGAVALAPAPADVPPSADVALRAEPPRRNDPHAPIAGPIAGQPTTRGVRPRGGAASKGLAALNSSPEPTGTPIGGPPRAVGDARVTDLQVEPRQLPHALAWADEGRTFFVVEHDGTLRRVALDGLREEIRWEVGRTCSWLAMSAEGLVLTVEAAGEVWTLDPGTLAVKARVQVGSARRAESAPTLGVALVTDRSADEVSVVDLKEGAILRSYDARSFPGATVGFKNLAVSPDGRFAFAEGSERLIRYKIEQDELIFDQASPRIAQNGKAVVVSPDGAFVALPSGGGNYDEAPYTTLIYRAEDFSAPAGRITLGPYPQALAFDPARHLIYAQNSDDPLIVCTDAGVRQAAYDFGDRNASSTAFAVPPGGGKLLAFSDRALRLVEPGLGPTVPAANPTAEPNPSPKLKAKSKATRPRTNPKSAPNRPGPGGARSAP